MKTYTLELDGKPTFAFRAEDDEEAATFPNLLYSPTSMFKKPEGKITVRPSTIPERAEWTRQSLWGDDEDDEREHDPDGLLATLNRDEEE